MWFDSLQIVGSRWGPYCNKITVGKSLGGGAQMQNIGTDSWNTIPDLTQAFCCLHVTSLEKKTQKGGKSGCYISVPQLFTVLCPNVFFYWLSFQKAANPWDPWFCSCCPHSGHCLRSRMSRKGNTPWGQDGAQPEPQHFTQANPHFLAVLGLAWNPDLVCSRWSHYPKVLLLICWLSVSLLLFLSSPCQPLKGSYLVSYNQGILRGGQWFWSLIRQTISDQQNQISPEWYVKKDLSTFTDQSLFLFPSYFFSLYVCPGVLQTINFKASSISFVAAYPPKWQCHIVVLYFWLVKETCSSKSISVLWYPAVLKAEI